MELVHIIGGGIGGLTMANALHRAGIDFRLYEQASQLTEVGAAIGISKSAFDVLGKLDLSAQVKDAGGEVLSLFLSDKNLREIRTITPEWPSVIIHRAKLIDILAAGLPREKIHLGEKLLSLESHADSTTLKFSSGLTRQSTCTVVADGINSIARNQLFPEVRMRFAGHTLWRGITKLDLPPRFQHTYTEVWADAKRFLFGPMDSGHVAWLTVQNSKAGELRDSDTTRKELINAYEDFHPLVIELLIKSSNFIRSELADLGTEKRKWYYNKVVFIGDAIHATTPNFAQGGCQAIEDAYCLSLLFKKHPNNFSEVFPVFQGLRNEKVSYIVNGSWQFGKIVHHPLLWRAARALSRYVPESVSLNMNKKINDLTYLETI